MPTTDTIPEVFAADRAGWRAWLAANGETVAKVWLVYYKVATGTPSVSYAEAVEEALCYGWIDSRVSPVDDTRYKQIFTPRKPGSVWSKVNKARVASLLQSNQITPVGLRIIEAAQRDGSWNALDAVEDLLYPDDFLAALRDAPPAQENFSRFSDSAKKYALRKILTAKRGDTRRKWIETITTLAVQNRQIV
ncbi:MAG: YdeI/OmpD-associated family protein [Armatimonadetes bacterium]|nr:YdeI/OmpD-associated family protein [Armatimonadota bacterium]